MARKRKEGWKAYCDAIDDNGLLHYEVAAEGHISPYTLSRWLRETPTRDRQEVVGSAIKSLLSKRSSQVSF